jgi:hypothetical protein
MVKSFTQASLTIDHESPRQAAAYNSYSTMLKNHKALMESVSNISLFYFALVVFRIIFYLTVVFTYTPLYTWICLRYFSEHQAMLLGPTRSGIIGAITTLLLFSFIHAGYRRIRVAFNRIALEGNKRTPITLEGSWADLKRMFSNLTLGKYEDIPEIKEVKSDSSKNGVGYVEKSETSGDNKQSQGDDSIDFVKGQTLINESGSVPVADAAVGNQRSPNSKVESPSAGSSDTEKSVAQAVQTQSSVVTKQNNGTQTKKLKSVNNSNLLAPPLLEGGKGKGKNKANRRSKPLRYTAAEYERMMAAKAKYDPRYDDANRINEDYLEDRMKGDAGWDTQAEYDRVQQYHNSIRKARLPKQIVASMPKRYGVGNTSKQFAPQGMNEVGRVRLEGPQPNSIRDDEVPEPMQVIMKGPGISTTRLGMCGKTGDYFVTVSHIFLDPDTRREEDFQFILEELIPLLYIRMNDDQDYKILQVECWPEHDFARFQVEGILQGIRSVNYIGDRILPNDVYTCKAFNGKVGINGTVHVRGNQIHDMDTNNGTSGSPIYVKVQNGIGMVGLHKGMDRITQRNVWVRIPVELLDRKKEFPTHKQAYDAVYVPPKPEPRSGEGNGSPN